MKLMLDIDIKAPAEKITYSDQFFLIGSCFTEHIGKKLKELKFPVTQNPNGILFDPVSVSKSLNAYIDLKMYEPHDLFYLNELWQSWNHHTIFSGMDASQVLQAINTSQQTAHSRLQTASWLIVTLGSSFSYRLVENDQPVANCHRAPSQWFKKHMLSIDETISALTETTERLKIFNPALKIIFTISPVRHIRDGVVENNQSKARLIEAVHHLVNTSNHTCYFPAYEMVIDVLRDYRFYDIDLVHPNYAATEFVFDKFEQYYIDDTTKSCMEEIRKISSAFKHKPFQPDTKAHQVFLNTSYNKVKVLQQHLPQLDFSDELSYFSKGNI